MYTFPHMKLSEMFFLFLHHYNRSTGSCAAPTQYFPFAHMQHGNHPSKTFLFYKLQLCFSFQLKRNMYHRELNIVVSFQPVKIIPVRLWQSVFCHLLAFISNVTHLGKKDIGLTRFLLQPHCKAAFLPKTFQEQKSIPVACIPPTCADHTCFNSHQMSALVGGPELN